MSTNHSTRRQKKIKLPVVFMATAMIALMWSAQPASADPPYVPAGPFVVPTAGPILPGPTEVPGKEFSSHSDKDHFHFGDPEQVVNWNGLGGTYDGVDYTGSRQSDPEERQVDALANVDDALFQEVINDAAHLLFSVDSIGGTAPGFDEGANVFYEKRITGGFGVWADQSLATPDGAAGSEVDVGAPIFDLDGLEVWGPEPPDLNVPDPPFIGDANRYSLGAGVLADPLGVSVWDIAGGIPATPLWLQGEIAVIISIASGINIDAFNPEEINLDGMMTFADEKIMFTIDPMKDSTGAPLFDGGEIFVGTRTGGVGGGVLGGSFLFHGGHLWDTAFPVMGTFGLLSENINALEAVSTVPEPASLVLASLALLSLTAIRRRIQV